MYLKIGFRMVLKPSRHPSVAVRSLRQPPVPGERRLPRQPPGARGYDGPVTVRVPARCSYARTRDELLFFC